MTVGRFTCRRRFALMLALAFCVASTAIASAQENPVALSAASKKSAVAPGGAFEVNLVAKIAEGWHLYSITQPPPPVATTIQVASGQPYAIDGDIDGPAPVMAVDPNSGEMVEFYEGEAAFVIPLKVQAGATPGKAAVRLQFRYQACSDSICLRPTTLSVDVPVEIVPGR